MKITGFQVVNETFTNSIFWVQCCASGHPKVTVTIQVNDTSRNSQHFPKGNYIICARTMLTSPPSHGQYVVTCAAKLGPFNCSREPVKAHTLCQRTAKTSNSSRTITINGKCTSLPCYLPWSVPIIYCYTDCRMVCIRFNLSVTWCHQTLVNQTTIVHWQSFWKLQIRLNA